MPFSNSLQRQLCRFAAAAALAMSALSSPAVALGQPMAAPSAEARAQAIHKYRQGSQAYLEHRYKDAIDLFLEADGLVGSNAALAYNTSLAYEAMGDPSSALSWAREYLRRAPEAADRAEVQRIIEDLESRLQLKGVQQVTVRSQPRGAMVIIDHKPVGVTPWTGELKPGEHSLELRHQGYEMSQRSFELTPADAAEVAVSLTPNAGASEPRGAERGLVIGGVTALGAAVASFGVAIGLEVARGGEETNAKLTPVQIDSAAHLDQMEDFQLGSRVAAGIGGALATAGGTMLVVGLVSNTRAEAQPISAGCGPAGCTLTLRGFF